MTFRTWQLSLLPLSAALLMAADQPQPWKDKQASEWNDADAKLILTGSPWAKTVKPAVEPPKTAQRSPARGMIGIPGMGGMGRMGGRGGYGYPGGGYPSGYPNGGAYPNGQQPAENYPAPRPPDLTLRWESALPVREAVMKSRDPNAPTIEDGFYVLAVYGVPSSMVDVESKSLPNKLKGLATIRRDGQKDLKPSSVVVLARDSGPVFLYMFARSKNPKKPVIKPDDRRIDFEAQIGRLKFGESFFLEDMVYKGNLEL